MTASLIELSSVVKDFHGLRPLRIDHLALDRGGQLAILGVDRQAAEVLINILTGVTLPDSGTVNLFGRSSAAIADSAEWLALVDRVGVVSRRAVLLEPLSVAQNLAMPFSLDIDPMPVDLRDRAIAAGREVGLADSEWDRRVSDIPAPSRLRVRLARAFAFNPEVVLIEHPTEDIGSEERASLGADFRVILARRGVAALTLTADLVFALAVAPTVLTLEPATGRLVPQKRRWFSKG